MRQLSLAFVTALIVVTALVAPTAAVNHPAVTAPPQTGTGTVAIASLEGIVLLLVAASALAVFASVRQFRRA